MTFAGLSGALVAGLFAAGSAALVALYLLKLRRRRVEVAFAALWRKVLSERETTSLLRRLKRWLSLLVQVALLGLLLLAIGDPRLGEVLEGRHVVVVLDASASMKATDVRPSRMARAREEAKRVVRGLPRADAALIVLAGAQPRPLGPWDIDPAAALRRIDGAEASDTAADIGRALDLALDALRGRARPVIVLVGDGAWPSWTLERDDLAGVDLRYVPVGVSGENLAISAFQGRRRPDDRRRFDLYLEVQSFREAPTEVTLDILTDGVLAYRQALRVGGGARAWRSLPDFGAGGGRIEARIAAPPGADHLAVDDRALAVVPERRTRRVLLVSEGNLFLEGALLADSDVVLERAAPAAYDAAAAARFDAVIFDRFTPPEPPAGASVLYVAPGAGSPFGTPSRLREPILTDVAREHPAMRGVSMRDVNIREARAFPGREGDVALAGSFGDAVVVARSDGARRLVAIGFDLGQSDLPLRAAFPVLLANLLDWFVGEESEAEAFATGATWRVPVAAGQTTAAVVTPSGRKLEAPVVDGRAVLWADEVGFYRVAGATIAASLGAPEESRIAPRAQLVAAGRALAPPRAGRSGLRRDIWSYLAALALVIAAVEWVTYHRRVTV